MINPEEKFSSTQQESQIMNTWTRRLSWRVAVMLILVSLSVLIVPPAKPVRGAQSNSKVEGKR
jgi:hypothetical protein